MAKNKIQKDIQEATEIITEIMREGLENISDKVIQQIMKEYNKLTPSKKIDAIKAMTDTGVNEYKNTLLTAMSVIVVDAIDKARREVPKASKVKLSETNDVFIRLGDFEELPLKVKKKLKSQIDILVATQKNDIDKSIALQFSSSIDTTEDASLLEYDLYEASNKYIKGPAIPAGASVVSARGINEGRNAFFFEDETLEEIDAFEFRNDSPVSPICQDLNGTVFSAKDPTWSRYSPPIHFNCKSYIVPILKGNLGKKEITRLQPSNSDLEKYIQFHDCKCCTGRVGLVDIDIDTNLNS
jgi:hypothetical protein